MKIQLPEGMTEEQIAAIADAVVAHGGEIVIEEAKRLGWWERFIAWWYSFWRGVGFN